MWDEAQLPANVRLGSECYVENPLSLQAFRSMRDPGLVLRDRVKVYGTTSFHVGPAGCVEIGEDSVIASTTLWCSERIEIGSGVVISYFALIMDSDLHPRDPEERRLDAMAHAPWGGFGERIDVETKPIVIEDGVRIGVGAIVLKGVRLGAGARVAPGAVVTKSVPRGAVAAGNPARIHAEEGDSR